MTIYTATSGALVFATGSMQWNWGLDGYNAPEWHPLRTSEAAQQVTRNVLSRMLERRIRAHQIDDERVFFNVPPAIARHFRFGT